MPLPACSTGAHAIGDAARMVALDDADVMVAGGAEAAVCRIGMAGFAAARAVDRLCVRLKEGHVHGTRGVMAL